MKLCEIVIGVGAVSGLCVIRLDRYYLIGEKFSGSNFSSEGFRGKSFDLENFVRKTLNYPMAFS